MENCIFPQEISTKEILLVTEDKDTVRFSGLMAVFIKENGEMVLKMEKDKFM